MAKYSSAELDAVYHALANSTRRKIITRLCTGDFTVTELAEPFDMSLAAVSKHIKVIEKAGLLKKTKENNTYRCQISYEPIVSAAALIEYIGRHMIESKRAA